MRKRALTHVLCVFVAISLSVACTPSPLPVTPTASATLPTLAPTVAPSLTATVPPSPTRPDKPQFIAEVMLRPLPGVGHNPQAIAILDDRIYVANRGTDNVAVLAGDKVSAVVAVGQAPMAIAADSTTGLVYVANEGEDTISFISGDRVVRTVPAPPEPACIVALDGRLYVGGRGGNALLVLDGISGELVATVPLGASIGILALAVNPRHRLLYASVYHAVEIVDLQDLSVVGRLDRQVYVTLEADPTSERFFVSEYDSRGNSQYLVAYDALGRKVLGRVPIGGDPRGMAVDPVRGRIYVANSWTNDVSVIDSRTLEPIATVPVGLQPLAVAVGKDGQVYVVNSGSENVAIVHGESSRLLRVVALALLPRGMAVQPDTGRLYVACASTNSVFVVEDQRVVAELPAGLHPSEVALSSDGEALSVLNYVGGDLMLVSTKDERVVKTTEIGRLPQGLVVVPDLAELYVSDTVLDAKDQRLLRGIRLLTIYGSEVKPVEVQIDAKAGRAYMVASNGVPGSNSGLIVYIVDLKSGEPVQGEVGGLSTTGLALDVEGERIFSTAGRFGFFQLIVDDSRSLKRVAALALPKFPASLAFNPQTHHIFIYLTHTSSPAVEPGAELWVLDSRGLGTVAQMPVPGELGPYDFGPYELAVDSQRGHVYLADSRRGTLWVFQDVALPPPPTPTPTDTPTPWPTLTPEPQPSPSATAVAEPSCDRAIHPRFEGYWSADAGLRLGLGCPSAELQSGSLAQQTFERGHILWRAADRTIFVLYNDGVWRSFPDRWNEGMPELSCEASAPGGLLQPKRGFGLVWCTEAGVREGLGWAVDGERGYADAWQFFERGQIIASGTRPVIYALFADGTYREYLTR